MAEPPTTPPSASISSISPAKTPASNQKNIMNFFRVTTPTPAAKREHSELKATPKKAQKLPPKPNKNLERKNSPAIVPEIFVLEEDIFPVKPESELLTVPPLPPVPEGATEVAVATADLSAPVPSLSESDAPLQAESVAVAIEELSAAASVMADPGPSDQVPSVDLTAEFQSNNEEGGSQWIQQQKQEEDPISKKRSRKKTQKYSDDQQSADQAPQSAALSTLSPEVLERLDHCQQKASDIVQSLTLEHSALVAALDICQRSEFVEIKNHIDKLLLLPADTDEAAVSQSMEELSIRLRKFTHFLVQDRCCTLPELLSALKSELDHLRDAPSLSSHCLADQIQSLLKPLDSAEHVKEFARRVSYGYRSNAEVKETSLFDDQSELALWRWELTVLPDDFPHTEDIKNAKTDFTRVGKAVRAILKVSAEITKSARATGTVSSQDEVKINALEDKVTAAMGEIKKANERKTAQLKKKLAQEAEVEKRLKRKEEQAVAKAAKAVTEESTKKRPSAEPAADSSEKSEEGKSGEAASRKKSKPLGEKELKEMATIEKQKSMLMSFFSSPTSKAKKTTESSASQPQSQVSAAEPDPLSEAVPVTVMAPLAAPAPRPLCTTDLSQFLATPLSMSDIVQANKKRYGKGAQGGVRYHRPHRKPLLLSVTVTAPQAAADSSAFDCAANNYAEIKDVFVDSRKRLLSFAEDFRPAYFGTFSKRSRLVSGRRPFAKDPLLNYEYDSEAEWEEEDPEGEDIALSDNEEDAEGDEIIYDDFFRPDNELDDPDGDPDAMAPSTARGPHAPRMTVSGVRFIGGDVRPRAIIAAGQGSGEVVEVASADADSEVLLNYTSVLHPPPLPGDSEPRPGSIAAPRLLCVGIPSRLAALGLPVVHRGDSTGTDSAAAKDPKSHFKDSMLPSLALFVHGKKEGTDKLVDAFIETLQSAESPVPPKAQIKKRILELAEKKKGSGGESVGGAGDASEKDLLHGSARWRVHEETAAKLGLELPAIEYSPKQKQKKRAKLLKGPTPIAAPVAVATTGEVTAGSASSLATDKAVNEASSETVVPVSSESSTVSLRQFFQPPHPQTPLPQPQAQSQPQEVSKTVETFDMTSDPEPVAASTSAAL